MISQIIQRMNTKLHLIKIFELKIYFNIMYCTISLHMYMWYCKYVYIVVEQEWNERNPRFCQSTKAARWKAERKGIYMSWQDHVSRRESIKRAKPEKRRVREKPKSRSLWRPEKREQARSGSEPRDLFRIKLDSQQRQLFARNILYLLSYNIRRTLYGVKN